MQQLCRVFSEISDYVDETFFVLWCFGVLVVNRWLMEGLLVQLLFVVYEVPWCQSCKLALVELAPHRLSSRQHSKTFIVGNRKEYNWTCPFATGHC